MIRESLQKPLLISCGILQPEIQALISCEDIRVEAVFLSKYLHLDYRKLHKALKASLRTHDERRPVVIYGDVCLGFNGEMKTLMTECDALKVDALNCIDCLLGGHGKLLEMDPDHRMFFLTSAFLEFSESLFGSREEDRLRFKMLEGIIVVDSLGDMERHWSRVEHFSDQTGLPVIEHVTVGLTGLKTVIEEALQMTHQ
jgi:hypothetical protein